MPVSILLVDDNLAKRLALRAVLTPLGHDVVEVDSGLAALRAIVKQDFAVILLDVRMPIMDGFETAALIRKRQQSEMTPIIFITAHGADEVVTTARYVEGAVDFIFAPVVPHELRAKVTVFVNLFRKAEILARRAVMSRHRPISCGFSRMRRRSGSSKPMRTTASSTQTLAGRRSPASRRRRQPDATGKRSSARGETRE
jgi:CheY-like chemotaxis protein